MTAPVALSVPDIIAGLEAGIEAAERGLDDWDRARKQAKASARALRMLDEHSLVRYAPHLIERLRKLRWRLDRIAR